MPHALNDSIPDEAVERMTYEEEIEARSREVAAWKTMRFADREIFKAQWRPANDADGQIGHDADNEMTNGRDLIDLKTPWEQALGDENWPIHEHLIDECLRAHGGTRGSVGHKRQRGGVSHGGGIVNKFRTSVRSHAMGKHVIRERPIIPADLKIRLEAACWQVHPGLCIERDAGIYETAIKVAKMLEKHCTKERKYKYHLLRATRDDRVVLEVIVFLAHVRARRRKVPVTHAFLRIQRSGRDLQPGQRAPELFEWATSWDLARQVLRSGGECLRATQLAIARIVRRVALEETQPDEIEVWPNPPVLIRERDLDAAELERLVVRKQTAKKVSGDVTLVVGARRARRANGGRAPEPSPPCVGAERRVVLHEDSSAQSTLPGSLDEDTGEAGRGDRPDSLCVQS